MHTNRRPWTTLRTVASAALAALVLSASRAAVAVPPGAAAGADDARRAARSAIGDPEEARWVFGPSLVLPEQPAGAASGTVLALGDVDGDGAPDVLIGAPGAAEDGREGAGQVVVYFGPGFDAARTLVDPEPASGARLGAAIVVADLDGDGRAEIIAGAPGGGSPGGAAADGSLVPGKVLIFAGPDFVAVRALQPSAGPESVGFGGALAASDVTGDGVPDLIVGDTRPLVTMPDRPRPDLSAIPEEGVSVFAGPDLGRVRLLRTASRSVLGPCSVFECSSFGAALAVGDLNGDGLGDLLVGEPYFLDTPNARGSVTAFAAPDLRPAVRIPAALAGQFSSYFGSALAVADLDGDGAADLVAGEPAARPPPRPADTRTGVVAVLTGFTAQGGPARRRLMPVAAARDARFGELVAVGDVDADGSPEIVVAGHAPLDHLVIFRGPAFTNSQVIEGVTGTALAVGDLNGDGRAEIVALASAARVIVLYSTPDAAHRK